MAEILSSSNLSRSSAGDTTFSNDYVPKNVIPLLSTTNEAYHCFTKQRFSNKLQVFMVNYVISVSSAYSIYK